MKDSTLLLAPCCAKCDHWDGEGFCSLPDDDKTVVGFVGKPEQVVCTKWVKIDASDEPETDPVPAR